MKFVAAIRIFSFILLGSLVSAKEEEDIANYIKGVIEGCKTKMDTPDDIFEKVITGKFDEGGANQVAMCLINCMMEEFGALKGSSVEAFEAFKEQINETEAKELLEKCQEETGKNECETGYKVYVCMKSNADKIFKTK